MQSADSPSSLVDVAATPRPRQGTLARNAFYLLLGQIATTAVSIALSAALGRKLGPADFGIYFLLMSMSTFAYVFVDWGQSALIIREAAKRPDFVGTLLGSSLVFRSLVAPAVVVLTALVARLLRYELRTQMLAALVVFCALPLALSQPYGYVFRSRERMDLDATVTVAAKVVTVVATLAVFSLGGRLTWAILAQLLGGAGALVIAVSLGRRVGLPALHPEWATVRALGAQGTSIAAFFVAIAVQPYLDAIVLSKLAPAEVVGYYGAARYVIGQLIAPAGILAAAAFPQMSRAAGHPVELPRVVRTALRPLLFLGALGAVGCYLFANVAVSTIYGVGHFYGAVTVLQLYAPALFFVYFDMLLATVATAVGRTRALAFAKLMSVVVSTGLALVLVPICQARWNNGGLGIVLAFCASEVVMLTASAAVLPRGTLDRTTVVDLVRAVVVSLAVVALFRFLPTLSPWLGIPLSIGLFSGLARAVGLVSKADLSKVAGLLKRN